jgi:F420-non-reducing hydrogenase iron-sulfur subunit
MNVRKDDKMKKLNITAFCCHNALYTPAEAEKISRPQVAGVQIIEVPCSGKIDAIYLLKAFEKGADGVAVVACNPEQCTTIEGCKRLGKRVERTKKLLAEAGLEPERLILHHVDGPSLNILDKILLEAEKEFAKLGPSPAR